ncbi:hypothetical protein NDU88_002194 [Pleurodeles waltl]|uniref:Uncharacterized protein n=1 Tax=Pleurodeles waltl TaxID=8319 RepID=A0AAV7P624_PLEWA|nr:hypothetical protein NDU88_002194 [Pleurodeles waltl]
MKSAMVSLKGAREVEIADWAIIVDPDAVTGNCLLVPGSDLGADRALRKAGGADCEEACGAGMLGPEAAHT